MSESHTITKKPSVMVALCCLAIVKRLRPAWVCISITQAAQDEAVSAQRVSRLASSIIEPLSALIETRSKRGRPQKDRAALQGQDQLALMQALLAVASEILKSVRLRRSAVAALVVGAYRRLKDSHPQLTQNYFCATLGIAQRTLRHWLATGLPTESTALDVPPAEPTRAESRQRRGRFGFDVTVAGTQLAADTTDIAAFGCPLKVMAAQDVGGRDHNLLDAVIVDDHENADRIVDLLKEALDNKPGMQVIVDQGAPYLAEKTRAACDVLGAELAVQREGHPQGKATVERAFGSVKKIAAPILALTDRIAQTLPQLRSAALAKASAAVLLTALLRAYQAGARAAKRAQAERAPADEQTLLRVAQTARDRAHADDHSVRLLLTHIHTAYQMDIGIVRFIRTFRRFPLPVLHQAERAFGKQAHRADIKKRTSYFAAIVRAKSDDAIAQRNRNQRDQALRDKLDDQVRRSALAQKRCHQDPSAWLRQALDMLALHWQPHDRTLLLGGRGIGLAALRGACNRLHQIHGLTAVHQIAHAVECDFRKAHLDILGPDGLQAVTDPLHLYLDDLNSSASGQNNDDCLPAFREAILPSVGPHNQRPPPPVPLRI